MVHAGPPCSHAGGGVCAATHLDRQLIPAILRLFWLCRLLLRQALAGQPHVALQRGGHVRQPLARQVGDALDGSAGSLRLNVTRRAGAERWLPLGTFAGRGRDT